MSSLLSRVRNFVNDKTNGVKITASYMDAELDQIIAGANRKVLCSGSSPGSPIAGQTWVDTTNKLLKLYRNNEWVSIGAIHVSGSVMATPQEGDLWYDTVSNVLQVYNGAGFDTVQVSGSGITGSYKGLVIIRPTDATVDIDADAIILADSDGAKFEATSVNLTANITASGANGLDTGSEANVWYYIWVIYNGTTTASLLSASSTLGTITLPSGYTYGALVGAVHNTSGDFVNFIQTGNQYWYSAWPSMASGTVSVYTSVDTTAYVPSAISNIAVVQVIATTNQNAIVSNLSAPGTDNTDIANIIRVAGNGTNSCVTEINIITANTLYWGASSGSLRIAGFKINKGVN